MKAYKVVKCIRYDPRTEAHGVWRISSAVRNEFYRKHYVVNQELWLSTPAFIYLDETKAQAYRQICGFGYELWTCRIDEPVELRLMACRWYDYTCFWKLFYRQDGLEPHELVQLNRISTPTPDGTYGTYRIRLIHHIRD